MKPARMILLLLVACVVFSACNKVPKNPMEEEQKKVLSNKGRLVGDLAAPANMHLAKIQGVVLIKGLAETGANEPPSMYQQMVLKELQRDNEKKSKAKEEIASMSTAIAILESVVLPGARKGDHMDVEVSLPPGSEATSIEGGYVEKALLRQFYTDDTLHIGDKLGIAGGFVMLDSQLIEKKDPKAYRKGRIVGGAIITKSRPLWLVIKEGERTCGVAQRIEDVINNRFSYLRNGSKNKVAEAKAGAVRVNLIVPDEYHDNINRYVNVVCAISFFETPAELQDRISELKAKLLDPKTSEFASLQLEAVGPNNPRAVEAIQDGLVHSDDMVRFHSAIAVAYMNIAKERSN
ncbi:MAG: flagellar basal body P-ring protein FlgI, partial [Thermoguttaceae bacterium]|nr:flagellar basal body P-ring protein FlgI [Thermoguttaceae bacterium]